MAKNIDFLLLGKTGYGKSATGNSILGRKQAFKAQASMTSVTFKSQKEIAQHEDGRRLLVVDAPGLCDTGGSKDYGEKLFKEAIKEAMVMNPHGYHVFILTLKFGNRFTAEDLNTIQFMKKLFGDDFVGTYCIIIMTCGDGLRRELKEQDIPFTDESFKDWCKEQGGEFQKLLQEVHQRIILFDNFGNDEEKALQRQNLIDMVDEKMLTGRRYTDKKFEKVLRSQQQLFTKDKTLRPVQNAQEEISLLSNEMEHVQREASIDAKISAFEQVAEKIKSLLKKIDEEEHKSPDLDKWRSIVDDKLSCLEKELSSLNQQKEIAETNRQKEELQALLDEQKRKEQERDKQRQHEKEQASLKLQKEIEEKNRLMQERRELQALQEEELRREKQRQQEEYIRVRNESNNKKAQSLWETVKSWFSW